MTDQVTVAYECVYCGQRQIAAVPVERIQSVMGCRCCRCRATSTMDIVRIGDRAYAASWYLLTL